MLIPPPLPYPRAALDAVIAGMCERRRYRFLCGPAGIYREALPRPRLRITYAQAQDLAQRGGIYEWGGPTGAKPGRFWLTAYPEPWRGAPGCKWRRDGIMLAMVTSHKDELGYLNFFWQIELAGEDLVLKAFAWLREPGRWRCFRCARIRCLTCRWAARRGEVRWSCACRACAALPGEQQHGAQGPLS